MRKASPSRNVTGPALEGGLDAIRTADIQRWWRAERVGALLLACPTTPWVKPEEVPIEGELALLRQVVPHHRHAMLRSVYEGSRRLGEVLSRRLKRPLSPLELIELFKHVEMPCLEGNWTPEHDGTEWRLERRGCIPSPPPVVCDYWREAIRGMAKGIGQTLRLQRLESVGHGGHGCVDLICGQRCCKCRETEHGAVVAV